MTARCHTPIPCPAFHPAAGDCGTVNHDLVIADGGLAGGDDAVSAALIQIYGEARIENIDGTKTGGWWGSEFLDFEFGSRLYAADPRDGAGMESAVRDAFRPLITAGLFDAVQVRAVETVNGPRIDIDAAQNGVSLFEVKI